MTKKLVCGMLALGSFGLLWAADAFTGTWKMNVGKSTFVKGKEMKEVTATVMEQGDTRMVTVKGTGGDGKAISTKYSMPSKGGPISYTEGGPAAGTTVVSKRVDGETIDSTSTLNGKQVGTSHAVVSADGKMLTVTRKGVNDKGKTAEGVEVFNRQ